MKLPTLIVACIAAAVVVFGVRNFNSEPGPTDAAVQAVADATAVPVSPIKTVTSASCPSDGCPVSCADEDTLLSAFCVSGTKARFADTLKLANGKLTATCGMGASNIVAYCGRQ
uniref:Triple helix repeat-containing collagen n=1 Tax=Rhodopseudomonas palustris (strain DX-1) TaxID=652103 RepID=E6VL09_RHOPX